MRSRGPLLVRLTPWVVFGVSFALSLATAWLAARIRTAESEGRFLRVVDDIEYVLRSRMESYEALLRSTHAMVATMPNGAWSEKRFADYVAGLELEAHYPGVQGLAVAAVFTTEEQAGLFAARRADSGPPFELRPPNDGREPLTSILYIEPLDARNRVALGFDMMSEPTRREAMLRARDTGQPTLTRPVTLIQEIDPEQTQPGFLLYLPLFDSLLTPTSIDERLAKLRGYVYAPFRAHDFFRASFATHAPEHVVFRVHDADAPKRALFNSATADDAKWFEEARERSNETIEMFGRRWTVEVAALPGFVTTAQEVLPLWIVVLGVLASALLFSLTRSQLEARVEIQRGLTELARGEALRAELAEQRAIALREASEKAALVDALFEAAPAGLAVVDDHHVFVRVNDALARLVGVSAGELIGKRFDDVLEEIDPAIGEGLERARVHGDVITTEAAVRPRDMLEEHTWLVQCATVHGSDERMLGVAVIVMDITSRKRMERELAEANRELDQFAYVASHDLKAPLRGIGHLVEWLAEDLGDDVPDAAREHMRAMRARVTRLEGLIDGILRYARAGRKSGRRERVNVEELVHEVVTLLAIPDGASVVVTERLPELVTERAPLSQVLMNLIGNALKHAHRPDVRIEIGVRDVGACYEFHVRDNGLGVDPADQERIWGVFQTARSGSTEVGTGIGLAVVRRIVEARGGTAWVESKPGQGATFCFTWPKHEPQMDDAEAQAALPAR